MLQENTCLFLNRQVRLSIKWTETHQIKYNKPFASLVNGGGSTQC